MAELLTVEIRGQAEFRKLDVTGSSEVSRIADAVAEARERVDVLVDNAGIAESASTFELDDATWNRTIAIDLTGSFLCAREFGKRMAVRSTGGSIIDVSSIAGFKAVGPEPTEL